MSKFLYFLYISILLVVSSSASAITGGAPQDPADTPWVAAIGQYTRSHAISRVFCTGTLVTTNKVLTAAHCILGSNAHYKKGLRIYIGYKDLKYVSSDHTYKIKTYDAHPGFVMDENNPNFANDIAIITLDRDVESIQPIKIVTKEVMDSLKIQANVSANASPDTQDKVGVSIYGWGYHHANGRDDDSLHSVDVGLMAQNDCYNSDVKHMLDDSQPVNFCTKSLNSNPMGGCSGDSGGPAIWEGDGRHLQLGVLSGGVSCGGVTAFNDLSLLDTFLKKHIKETPKPVEPPVVEPPVVEPPVVEPPVVEPPTKPPAITTPNEVTPPATNVPGEPATPPTPDSPESSSGGGSSGGGVHLYLLLLIASLCFYRGQANK